MFPRTSTRRSERGAVAIVVGLTAVLLFSMSALAVDLGNQWSRKRNIQKQADVSALAAGYLLPMVAGDPVHGAVPIAAQVRKLINASYNKIEGQPAVPTTANLLDGNVTNGEVYFQHDDTAGSPCATDCNQMRVFSPRATVNFGFASVVGVSSSHVQRAATVRVVSQLPPKAKTLPFWLPSGCGYGPTEADTTQGGGQPTATATPTPTATATTGSPTPFAPTPLGLHTLTGAAVSPVGYGSNNVTVSGYGISDVESQYKNATIRAFPPDGSANFVDLAGVAVPKSGSISGISFVVPTAVTNVPGDWQVYAVARKKDTDTAVVYSKSAPLIIRITGGPTPTVTPTTATPTPTPSQTSEPLGCIGQDKGNFGQLDSPHTGYNLQQSLAPNIAFGLDHKLVPYVFPEAVAESDDCGKNNTVSLPGGKHDDTAGALGDGANCIQGNTGNDGPKIYDGLVGGVDGHPARLDVANGSTTCAGRSNLTVGGKSINNDSLACFLRNGATLADLASDSATQQMLDPSIINSSRLVYLPVVYATNRAQKNFQPIKAFVAGFITEETLDTGPVDGAGLVNGLELNGNSVKVLHVFVFNRAALPPDQEAPDGTYDPDLGASIVRLVR